MVCFYRRLLRWCLLFGLGISLCILTAIAEDGMQGQRVALSASAGQLVDQGLNSYQAGRYPEAIAVWEKALTQTTQPGDRAIVQTNLGQAYRRVGKSDRAIAHWEQAIQFYQSNRDVSSQQTVAQLLTEQAQAYSDLGQHQTAIYRLKTAIKLAQKNRDELTEAAAQGALGNAYWALGTYKEALTAHQKSLGLACKLENKGYVTTALNNLGNAFASRSERVRLQATVARQEEDTERETTLTKQADHDNRVALAAYLQSADVSRSISGLAEAKALLNLNRLLRKLPDASPVTMPELACETLNVEALLTPPDRLPGPPAGPSNSQVDLSNPSRIQSRILALLDSEPDSQDKAYGYINLVNNRIERSHGRIERPVNLAEVDPLLQKALTTARNIGDARAESYALGTLAEVYESNRQYDQAISLSRQAQFIAQKIGAGDSLYRWQWQMGRIYKATGQTDEAIKAYEQAVYTLQSLRDSIVGSNKDLQFDFRESVEPVYRQLIGLLLEDQGTEAGGQRPGDREWVTGYGVPGIESKQKLGITGNQPLKTISPPPTPPYSTTYASSSASTRNIARVLDILELLKLAELQNFFGDDCVRVAKDATRAELSPAPDGNNQGTTYGLIDSGAAIIYSIVLEDKTYMVLRLPDGTLKKYPILANVETSEAGTRQLNQSTLSVSESQIEAMITGLRRNLEKRSTEEYWMDAARVYDALIRPMEADLQATNPKTLVFVNDGVLRKVPMAALYDGKQFLIQKYAIATTPSLSLTTRRPFNRNHLRALIMGLTLQQEPFSALPNVERELTEVQKLLGGTKLLNQAFTLKSMQQQLEQTSYSIIHMATHGRFSADPDDTYLLAYGDRITIDQLEEVLRSRRSRDPVELLTLSACQTATGDNRAALGIAGVAVRAGVKSAVATLWFINDEATVPLIQEFYKQLLKPNVTKAEALRQAQLEMIADRDNRQYKHPAVWSPFILIGNWL
ncbi:CHAT domain-containing protein [Leptothermofonsia sichuanensis E412]|uniref:CHAT domain-containing protein n=1 Tax=Leptothermofonsia sichuanensis TaxID=2917832 RepID=UPI001CA79F10|nr:CHAT domain-containing protein [Leptothermofonsia sichuanensis]QZZ22124.1 CHAT domain-containing protein [Leptothermofonsia sichuanensis E412]